MFIVFEKERNLKAVLTQLIASQVMDVSGSRVIF